MRLDRRTTISNTGETYFQHICQYLCGGDPVMYSMSLLNLGRPYIHTITMHSMSPTHSRGMVTETYFQHI